MIRRLAIQLVAWRLIVFALPCDAGVCALTVQVYDAVDHVPIESLVVLTDVKGLVRREELSRAGAARFCDLPFGEYRVLVRSKPCGQTEVSEIRIGFRTERIIKVFDNGCPHAMFPTILRRPGGFELATCEILVRAQSAAGKPIAGVEVRGDPETKSDEFGRMWFSLAAREVLAITLVHAGYADQPLELKCGDSYRESEQTVIMHRPRD